MCFRTCTIGEDDFGYCKTRYNHRGRLRSITYGMISNLSIDKIEDKPFRHFMPGTKCLSVGSFGCNFKCVCCQNSKASWNFEEYEALLEGRMETSCYVPPEVIAKIAQEFGCEGVAFTFNEPAISLEYVHDVATKAKEMALYTVYVTNSSMTLESLDVLANCIDAIATDIKSTDDRFYQEICLASDVAGKVLQSIKYANDKGIHIETRTNIIPGYNDSRETVSGICAWIKANLGEKSPWHITKFHPVTELKGVPATPEATITNAFAIAKQHGLENVYIEDKPCDCAKGTMDRDLVEAVERFQGNGVIFGDRFCETNQSPCCCH
jgi:pyruvate formate lyase activating enzyme